MTRVPVKIVSGGQTGVDRAALDAALELGLAVGGWCPRGRLAEDGPIPSRYPLQETDSTDYPRRTELNVTDSDGTLILSRGPLNGGTLLTRRLAECHGKPLLVVDLGDRVDAGLVADWVRQQGLRVLNVAGPRESGNRGVQGHAKAFLRRVFRLLHGTAP